ncbi:hypothetical protein BSS2_II0222 [Brucella suis bv. 1 str. S2]|uniref:Uncharacterized protein n=5 Tax=Brucella TaxID=234 RepID=C0RKH2_BRUMB|nr:hypothetical protein BRA0237 [Brucella suis 1330]ABX63429.1 Hypothetical protein, conserved [Brucella canis ATCC 23365]ABY39255.1 Hypothetical protein, conserved [Brucella suis ATCC 23445]ACO02105.1 Hypothetical protein, conserved [Brucella melitensis ATCC 23457]ACU49369.1 hypothetical protein BMI_II233 [Brucella microti CCM 4915]AEK55688.1 hypothetical protein BPI_II234 [Brucella pinnipedialis B2/94]AEU07387.1 hypothetical protein BSVBI22_B0233 [Brucella suis VBI22]AHN47987.1 hypothetica
MLPAHKSAWCPYNILSARQRCRLRILPAGLPLLSVCKIAVYFFLVK